MTGLTRSAVVLMLLLLLTTQINNAPYCLTDRAAAVRWFTDAPYCLFLPRIVFRSISIFIFYGGKLCQRHMV